MLSRKRRREEPPSIHPRNRYAEKPPDFAQLASLYPSFESFVFFSRSGRPTIDWKDFNATRELTRVLLLHDHAVNWWIPDGQLCPTVPNRSNYIHWINDLLSSELIPVRRGWDGRVRGFDIGTGANCIYPLLGASLLGWSFVGSDVIEVALEWASKNVENNPHLLELIQIRNANDPFSFCGFSSERRDIINESNPELHAVENTQPLCHELKGPSNLHPPILVGVVRDGESFDFCMCNPPFFESFKEAGLNPKTSCGGTLAEMVYPGGERAFITHIIEDSVVLKCSFRWFSTMVGKKANLKLLISKLREVGVSIVKTTEFVQGQTARWGLAWSFIAPCKDFISSNTPMRSQISFTLEDDIFIGREINYLQLPIKLIFVEAENVITAEAPLDGSTDQKFLIRCKDKSPSEDTWVTLDELQNLANFLRTSRIVTLRKRVLCSLRELMWHIKEEMTLYKGLIQKAKLMKLMFYMLWYFIIVFHVLYYGVNNIFSYV